MYDFSPPEGLIFRAHVDQASLISSRLLLVQASKIIAAFNTTALLLTSITSLTSDILSRNSTRKKRQQLSRIRSQSMDQPLTLLAQYYTVSRLLLWERKTYTKMDQIRFFYSGPKIWSESNCGNGLISQFGMVSTGGLGMCVCVFFPFILGIKFVGLRSDFSLN